MDPGVLSCRPGGRLLLPTWKLALAYVTALVVAFLSERLVPGWSGVLIAAVFLYLPFWVARRDDDPARRWGLTLHGWPRSLRVGLLWCALVFPPFVVGFSALQRVAFQHTPTFDVVRLQRWDDGLYAAVDEQAKGLVVHARTDDRLQLSNAGAEPARLRLGGTAVARGVALGRGATQVAKEPGALVIDLAPAAAAVVRRPDTLTVAPLAPAGLGLVDPAGAPLAPPGAPLTLDAGLGWWLGFALWQLALIALSEELFFRGFLQTGLNALWKRRWRLLGADVGLAWPVTSALFAIGHLATTPHPARLLVFFPGLLMGWLRERTGGLLAPIVFHGLSNLLMELLVRLHAG